MTCAECHAARQFPGHIRFDLKCLHCGARLIQTIQRLRPMPTVQETTEAQIKRRCRTVLDDWVTYGHVEQEVRTLAKGATAIASEPARSKGRK